MTDNEAIKALECCTMQSVKACSECPYHEYYSIKCIIKRSEDIVDLINRLKAQNKEFDEKIAIQKAEIERLKAERDSAMRDCAVAEENYQNAKLEATKLFAKKLKIRFERVVDNIIKEMVGDGDD